MLSLLKALQVDSLGTSLDPVRKVLTNLWFVTRSDYRQLSSTIADTQLMGSI